MRIRRDTVSGSIAQRMGGALLASALAIAAIGGCGGDATSPVSGTVAGQLVVTNGDASVTSCTVTADGEIDSCALREIASLGTPGGVEVAGDRLYVADLGHDALEVCGLDANAEPTTCETPAHGDVLKAPLGVVAAGGRLFLSNGDGSIAACALDGAGRPRDCALAAPAGTFANPAGLAAYDRFLLIADQRRNAIAVCDARGATLERCTTDDGDGAFAQPTGVAVAGDRLFVTNVADDSITVCRITSDGALAGCVESPHVAELAWPMDIAVNGSVVYVTNAGTHALVTCVVRPNGAVTDCEEGAAGELFLYPNGLHFVAGES